MSLGEYFNDIHNIVLDGISDNMVLLAKSGKYGAINTVDTMAIGYYVVKNVSENLPLQEDITTEGKVSKASELGI